VHSCLFVNLAEDLAHIAKKFNPFRDSYNFFLIRLECFLELGAIVAASISFVSGELMVSTPCSDSIHGRKASSFHLGCLRD